MVPIRDCTTHTRVPDTRVLTWYPIPWNYVYVPGYKKICMVLGDGFTEKSQEKMNFLIQASDVLGHLSIRSQNFIFLYEPVYHTCMFMVMTKQYLKQTKCEILFNAVYKYLCMIIV